METVGHIAYVGLIYFGNKKFWKGEDQCAIYTKVFIHSLKTIGNFNLMYFFNRKRVPTLYEVALTSGVV